MAKVVYGWLAASLLLPAVLWAQVPVLDHRFVGPAEAVEPGSALSYPLDVARLGVTLPHVPGTPEIERILHDPRTVYYKLFQTYQQFIPPSRIEHKDLTLGQVHFTSMPFRWGIFRTSFLADFNANKDFPWETTIGLNAAHHRKDNPYGTFNFLSLPRHEDGRLIPVLLLADERPIKWIFPAGTVVGEVIYVTHEGEKHVQEVRTRKKDEKNKKWFPGVYRPVRDREELSYLTGITYEPARKFMSLRNPEEDEVFQLQGTVERLPNLPPAMVRRLLSRPFQDVTRSNWSPAADTDFNLLPKDYSFGLFPMVDSQVCAGCHRQTSISVRNLTPREPTIINNPRKLGNIRGSDAVFTWHPFSHLSIRSDDDAAVAQRIYCRSFDINNGIVQINRRGQRSEGDYKITAYVQEALEPYELPSVEFLHPARVGDVEDAMPRGSTYPPPDGRVVVPAPAGQVVAPLPSRQGFLTPPGVLLPPAGTTWEVYQGSFLLRRDGIVIGVYNRRLGEFRYVDRSQFPEGRLGPIRPVPYKLPPS